MTACPYFAIMSHGRTFAMLRANGTQPNYCAKQISQTGHFVNLLYYKPLETKIKDHQTQTLSKVAHTP
jgi:hypothetical protein